jgi:hypothetical protein
MERGRHHRAVTDDDAHGEADEHAKIKTLVELAPASTGTLIGKHKVARPGTHDPGLTCL